MERKILIVDDEDEIRELLSVELERHGFVVATAESGKECLKKIKDENNIRACRPENMRLFFKIVCTHNRPKKFF